MWYMYVGLYGCVCVCVCVCAYENEKEVSIFSNAAKVLRDPHCGFPWKHEILSQKQMAGSWRKGHGNSHLISSCNLLIFVHL